MATRAFSAFVVELHIKPGIECETDAQVEAMAERIEDADFERILKLSTDAILAKAGLDGEIVATVKA